MTAMTIKEACERVQQLRENIKQIGSLDFMLRRDFQPSPNKFLVRVYNDRYVSFSVSRILIAMSQQAQADQAEIDKLQPVIDMANAALKGVMSES